MKRFFSTVLAASALLVAVSSHAAEYEFMFIDLLNQSVPRDHEIWSYSSVGATCDDDYTAAQTRARLFGDESQIETKLSTKTYIVDSCSEPDEDLVATVSARETSPTTCDYCNDIGDSRHTWVKLWEGSAVTFERQTNVNSYPVDCMPYQEQRDDPYD